MSMHELNDKLRKRTQRRAHIRKSLDGTAGKPGTGLGLAICRAIVEAHGGSIAAGNRPDGGACVRFTLPRGTPPVVEEEIL